MLPASVVLLGWGNIVLSFFFLTLSLQSQLLLPLDICLLLLLFFLFYPSGLALVPCFQKGKKKKSIQLSIIFTKSFLGEK